eukprot:1187200-Prorocentrum_minimum.AAC.3
MITRPTNASHYPHYPHYTHYERLPKVEVPLCGSAWRRGITTVKALCNAPNVEYTHPSLRANKACFPEVGRLSHSKYATVTGLRLCAASKRSRSKRSPCGRSVLRINCKNNGNKQMNDYQNGVASNRRKSHAGTTHAL